jgi:citrate synthase
MGEHHWTSNITAVAPNSLKVRGYSLDDLMGRASFGQMVFLLLKERLPTPSEGRMIEAILVSSVDHGVTPPSALSALTVASTGAPLNASVVAGILSISKFHGGAIEDCMRLLASTRELLHKHQCGNLETAADMMIEQMRHEKRRLPGFGHRIHTADPRTAKLFALSAEYGISGDCVTTSQILKARLLEKTGKKLPINVDGAIAAILCDMGFDPACANGLFMIARLPGLIAHVIEEQSRQKPMRKIDPVDHSYDGPDEKQVPNDWSIF